MHPTCLSELVQELAQGAAQGQAQEQKQARGGTSLLRVLRRVRAVVWAQTRRERWKCAPFTFITKESKQVTLSDARCWWTSEPHTLLDIHFVVVPDTKKGALGALCARINVPTLQDAFIDVCAEARDTHERAHRVCRLVARCMRAKDARIDPLCIDSAFLTYGLRSALLDRHFLFASALIFFVPPTRSAASALPDVLGRVLSAFPCAHGGPLARYLASRMIEERVSFPIHLAYFQRIPPVFMVNGISLGRFQGDTDAALLHQILSIASVDDSELFALRSGSNPRLRTTFLSVMLLHPHTRA